MAEDDAPDTPPFELPYELEPGVYSNSLSVWYTGHEFTLDFAVLRSADADGDTRDRVVARLRVPVTMSFDVLRSINEAMTAYEATFGEIRRLGP